MQTVGGRKEDDIPPFWSLGLLYAAATSYYFAREAVEAHLIVTKTLIDSVLRENRY